MLSVYPATGPTMLAPATTDRDAAQPVANSPAPVSKPEISRPVTSPGASETISALHRDRENPQAIYETPMAAISEILSRADSEPGQQPDLIAPPVPMRYLSAFMLQSALARNDQVDEKI